jgi:thiosulfate dehydrogenase (quinone) large subunit
MRSTALRGAALLTIALALAACSSSKEAHPGGVALVIGVLSLPAALASLLTLITYWSSDQLIAQYPIMGILSAIVIAWSAWAARLSATSLIVAVLNRKQIAAQPISGPLRRWL